MKKHIVIRASAEAKRRQSILASCKRRKVCASKKDYGGAYDLEGAGFFTKDDLMEFMDVLQEEVRNRHGVEFEINEAFIDDNPKYVQVEMVLEDASPSTEYAVASCKFRVDMRKIRKPSDLQKYVPEAIDKLIADGLFEFQGYHQSVTSATVEELQAGMQKYTKKQNKVGQQLDDLKSKALKKFGPKQEVNSATDDDGRYVQTDAEAELEDAIQHVWGEIRMEVCRQLGLPDQIGQKQPFDIDVWNHASDPDVVFSVSFKDPVPDWDTLSQVCEGLRYVAQYYDQYGGGADIDNNQILVSIGKEEIVKEDVNSATSIEGTDNLPGPGDFEPPSYPDPKSVDAQTEYVEFDFDCEIQVSPDGSWDYTMESDLGFMDGNGSFGDWYSDEHNVMIASVDDVQFDFGDLLTTKLPIPEQQQTYHISGSATLAYTISGIEDYRDYQGLDEDGDPIIEHSYDADNANSEFDIANSSISNWRCDVVEYK